MKKLFTFILLVFTLQGYSQGLLKYDNMELYTESGKYGIRTIDSLTTVLPAEYGYICTTAQFYEYGLLVRQGDKCQFFNHKTKKFHPLKGYFRNNENAIAFPIAEDDKYGLVDSLGDVIAEGQWDAARFLYGDGDNTLFRVTNSERYKGAVNNIYLNPIPGKTGYINARGEYVIPMEYSYIDFFVPNVDVTRFTNATYDCDVELGCQNPYKSGKWGLINKKGEIVLPDTIYNFISYRLWDDRNEQLVFCVEKDSLKGVINYKGELIYPLAEYVTLSSVWDSFNENNKLQIKDDNGKLIPLSQIKPYKGEFGVNGLIIGKEYTHARVKAALEDTSETIYFDSDEFRGTRRYLRDSGCLRDEFRWTKQEGFNEFTLRTPNYSLFDGRVKVGLNISVFDELDFGILMPKEGGIYSFYFGWYEGHLTIVTDEHKTITSLSYSIPD